MYPISRTWLFSHISQSLLFFGTSLVRFNFRILNLSPHLYINLSYTCFQEMLLAYRWIMMYWSCSCIHYPISLIKIIKRILYLVESRSFVYNEYVYSHKVLLAQINFFSRKTFHWFYKALTDEILFGLSWDSNSFFLCFFCSVVFLLTPCQDYSTFLETCAIDDSWNTYVLKIQDR